MRKIGIIIEEFEPIHQGYIQSALLAKKEYNLDEVLFIPIGRESDSEYTKKTRLVKQTIKDWRHFKYLDFGCVADKKTILEKINKTHKDSDIYVITNDNSLNYEGCKTICYLNNQQISEQIRNGDFTYLKGWQRSYLMENGLYQESIAKSQLTEKRWQHVQRVAKLCVEMAKGNRLDVSEAYMAGIFHDCAKKWPKEEMETYMNIYCPKEKELHFNTWHQFVGADYLKRYCKLRNKEVLKAIRHHCLGDNTSELAMIVYCADKLDPGRGYDSSKEIALCCKDIKAGYIVVKQQQQEYLEKEGVL